MYARSAPICLYIFFAKVLNSLENKKKMVLDFIAKGEKLMLDENCPKFLEGHVKKLKEAWEDTNEKAQIRKKALTDNLQSWEVFEDKKVECHKHLDTADAEYDQIKKIFDLTSGKILIFKENFYHINVSALRRRCYNGQYYGHTRGWTNRWSR